jgi:hypothetical protein
MVDVTATPPGVASERHSPGVPLRDIGIAMVMSALSILLMDPIFGTLPGINLDLSWPYTLADATAHHIPFGRDMVFTFGPLSSIYTRFFLPDKRLAVVILKAVLVLAFCLSALAMSRRSVRWVALALPLLLANLLLTDPFFLVAPWLLVALAARPIENRHRHAAGLVALAVVLGPLLLVKGTLALPLAMSVGAAAIAVVRRSWALALALPCAALASVVVAWVATGQQILDLPYYIRREAYVAGGYTNAMSQFGDSWEIWVFLAGTAVLLVSHVAPRRSPPMPLLAGAAILFVAFKAGFVRHDGHSNIAGGTLALLGFLLFLYRGTVAAGVGLLASLAAWTTIAANYWPIDLVSSWTRMTSALDDNVAAIRAAEVDSDAFRRSFDAAKAAIAAKVALPPTTGVVDLYPDSQAILLASNRDYYPRPVMQSYSAYTPELAFLNADHLQSSHAPQTVFFGIDPIDEHYPTMEDGPSWPALLGQYRFRTYSGPYAVIDRVPGASAGTIDATALSGSPRFGDTVTVPDGLPFIWVKMQFRPTLIGRAASAFFKLPLLHMDVTTADGRIQTYRVIPGMASAGFLLSPTVLSAHDFVALRSTATDALAGQRVTAVRLHEDGDLHLWGDSFAIQFAALHIPTDTAVDDAVLGHLDAGPAAADLPEAGECTIDMVGSEPYSPDPIPVKGKTVTVTGWGYTSPAVEGKDGGDLRIALTPENGATVYAKAIRTVRQDVDANFHLAKTTHAGFTAQVNLAGFDGAATLRVVQDTPSGTAACGPAISIIR